MAKRKPFEPKPETELTETEASIAEAEAIDAPEVLTVNGKPIPPEFLHAIPYAQTDQGIAEAARSTKLKATPGVSVVADAWDKQIQRRAEAEVWDGFDPLREAVDGIREPGMAYRFISDRVVARRGRRGWEPAPDKDGNPVRVAGMTLGKMPIERADRRNLHYQQLAQEQLANAAESYEVGQAKLIRESGVKGMSPLRVGEQVKDNHQHPGLVTEVGVRTARGEVAAE